MFPLRALILTWRSTAGQSQSRSTMIGANDPVFTNKPLPPEPTSGTYTSKITIYLSISSQLDLVTSLLYAADLRLQLTGTGFGQSSLTGNSYPDRSVGNHSRPGDQSGSSHVGRDAALGAGAVGTKTHHHEDPQRENYAPETGRSFPLGGSSISDNYGSSTTGPYSSNLENKAGPRIDSEGPRTLGNTGYGSTSGGDYPSNGPTSSSTNQGSLDHDRSAAGSGNVGSVASPTTGYGPESWQHEHQHHGHQYEGDPCETGVTSHQEGPHFVSGPHLTDTANRLDPHIGSGVEGATGDTSGHHHHRHHGHRGEEAALAGGAGGAGLGALEADRSKYDTTGNTTSSAHDPSNTNRHGIDSSGGMSMHEAFPFLTTLRSWFAFEVFSLPAHLLN